MAQKRATSGMSKLPSNPPRPEASGCTLNGTRCPSRITEVWTFRPSGVSWTSRVRWRVLRTFSPSNSTITSPVLKPAVAAGLSRVTSSTTTPIAAGSFSFVTSSSVTSRTETPIQLPPPANAKARGAGSTRTARLCPCATGPRAVATPTAATIAAVQAAVFHRCISLLLVMRPALARDESD